MKQLQKLRKKKKTPREIISKKSKDIKINCSFLNFISNALLFSIRLIN